MNFTNKIYMVMNATHIIYGSLKAVYLNSITISVYQKVITAPIYNKSALIRNSCTDL